ncbi:hypothetical protein DMB66_34085 [Actinoplanes sp. ATCC 53533]|nr:hypothetical protein DMB66_34085 [Actinoplanes sp. ATCC 53533]
MGARMKKGLATAAALIAATATVVMGGGNSSSAAAVPALQAYGIAIDGSRLLSFQTNKPGTNDWVMRITGWVGDTYAIGLDFRVQDGKLYVVGEKGGIYTIGIPSGVVTKVSQLSVPLYGTKFGVDFNPAADRLRVISDNAQNLRHNLADGTTVEDTTLTTPPLTGPTRQVTAAAYTNNDLSPDTNTTLFDIATATDQVVIQSPANQGFLVATGSLGFDAGLDAGLDIYSDLSGGKTVSATAFASLTPYGGEPTLYTIDLLTGASTNAGLFALDVTDIAIALDTM